MSKCNKKLSEEDVIAICKALNKGAKLKDLALYYGVTMTTISLIATKKMYKDIGEKYLKERIKNTRGERHHNSKLSEEEVKHIRNKIKEIEDGGLYLVNLSCIAEQYGVSSSVITNLKHNKSYKDLL